MTMSFHEKSLWLMSVSLFGFALFYFGTTLPTATDDVLPRHIAKLVLAIVVMVLIQIAGHIAIALVDRRTETDERDRLIGLMGTRNGAYVLATGVFMALCAALVTKGNFTFTHVLLGAWVLAQLVEFGTQLLLQRRGV
ncbi:MAG: hypothetical protein V4857_25405 [Pseudomonadota bacterium]